METSALKSVLGDKFTSAWLSEGIIDAYLYHLCAGKDNILSFPCCVLNLFHTNGNTSPTVQRFLRKCVMTSPETILAPANITGNHWVLLVIKPKVQEIHLYDPLNRKCSQIYLNFIPKLVQLFNNYYSLAVTWGIKTPPHILQQDASSCGVLLCFYAEQIVSKTSADVIDTVKYRKSIYDLICGQCLQNKHYSAQHCIACQSEILHPNMTAVICYNSHQPCHLHCLQKQHSNMLPGTHRYRCSKTT